MTMTSAVILLSFMLSDIFYPDILPKVCMLSLPIDTQKSRRGAGHRHIHCFLSSVLDRYSSYFVFPQDIYDCPCLSNSYDLVQLAFFHSRCPRPPLLLQILQWNLQQVSLRQQHCRTSVLLRHYIQPLSSPALISARGRGDKNGHTISK